MNHKEESEEAIMKKALLLGLAALAMFAGNGLAATMVDEISQCEVEGGWYDRAAGACDSMGD